MTLAGTIDACSATERTWSAVVVGAGPAGAFAALELARRGVETLLVDAQSFPRPKVCGGCLNARTLGLLAAAGLETLPRDLGGVPLSEFELRAGGRGARLEMPNGIAVSRAALDAGLVREAIAAGAHFLPATRAVLGDHKDGARHLALAGARNPLRAAWVVAADGLGGGFLARHSERRSLPVAGSRLGAGAVLEDRLGSYSPGTLHMAVGRGGYVGVTRVEEGRIAVAAALDRSALESDGGPDAAIAKLLAGAGLPEIGSALHSRGTAALSRAAPDIAFDGVFLIGDAAGYVEPFTGEGISWALEAAGDIAALLGATIRDRTSRRAGWLETRWRLLYRQRIKRRQRWCRAVSWGLRRQAAVSASVWLLGKRPALATPLLAHLNAIPRGKPA